MLWNPKIRGSALKFVVGLKKRFRLKILKASAPSSSVTVSVIRVFLSKLIFSLKKMLDLSFGKMPTEPKNRNGFA